MLGVNALAFGERFIVLCIEQFGRLRCKIRPANSVKKLSFRRGVRMSCCFNERVSFTNQFRYDFLMVAEARNTHQFKVFGGKVRLTASVKTPLAQGKADARIEECGQIRSEEHTSELQSQFHLVFRLLL